MSNAFLFFFSFFLFLTHRKWTIFKNHTCYQNNCGFRIFCKFIKTCTHIWQEILIKNQTVWRSKGDQQEQGQGGNMFNTQCVLGWKHNTKEYSWCHFLKSTCIGIIIDVCPQKWQNMKQRWIPDRACWYIHISFSLQLSVPDAYRNLTFIFYFFSPMAVCLLCTISGNAHLFTFF